ncbi:Uma2 family endonuclease [Endozoicomonas arenosclerae]|uniref:Uma2 family endonuclease n=1 Tax=Endozoicomonas arenosclerae TaxID=1633495 RepID=UPI001560AB97|nr:Uma2 family endonuclease [Endozoicomonas arenosclerae]
MKNLPVTVDEYLESELTAPVKREYINGYVYAMVGSSRRHNLLAMRLGRLLGNHLEGSCCDVFGSDMKVRAGAETEDVFFYPDVMVSCNRGSENPYVEEQPKLIIEVLSRTTEQHDRLTKLEAYTQIPTLEEYVLVSQYEFLVDVYRRSGEHWQSERLGERDRIQLTSVDFELSVLDVYKDIIGVV